MSEITIGRALTDPEALGRIVTVKGWVRTRRQSKSDGGLSFLSIHDGSCFDSLQVIARASLTNYESEVTEITSGCSVVATGRLVESEGAGQKVEVQADSIEVIGWIDDPQTYPLAPKRHSFEYLREIAHLRVRTNTFGAVTRVRHCLSMAVHRFFDERGFVWVHTPVITANDAEGAGAMFRVSTLDLANIVGHPDYSKDFFGQETFLTVSRSAECRKLLPGDEQGVHIFGPTSPSRELPYSSPSRRVLDGRTGDCVRRPLR